MDTAFSILMFCFSGMLLLYAGLLALAKDPQLIPRHYYAKIKNPKAYALQFAKLTALTAAAPALSGLVGLSGCTWAAVAVLLGGFVVCIWLGIRLFMKDVI